MKKNLLIAALLLLQTGAFAQTKLPYINTSWPQGIDSLKNEIGATIGDGYTFTRKSIFEKQQLAYISFKNDVTGNEITVKLTQGKAGVNPHTIVERVDFYGYFTDIAKIYGKLFDPNLIGEEVKARGVAYTPPVTINGKQYIASIYPDKSKNVNFWYLTIKD